MLSLQKPQRLPSSASLSVAPHFGNVAGPRIFLGFSSHSVSTHNILATSGSCGPVNVMLWHNEPSDVLQDIQIDQIYLDYVRMVC